MKTANRPEFRDLAPSQIVPRLADGGCYIASESSFYRVLKQEGLLRHRSASKPRQSRAPQRHVATARNQVWAWDITYLRAPVRGQFFYLYLFEDVWSRKIIGYEVHEEESMVHSARLIDRICRETQVDPKGLVLHSDNGGPMKGATMLATLQRLGVVPSFSRPHVSDDNAYCEALFKTLKYRPGYPRDGFASLEAAKVWLAAFVAWYNEEHLHSGIGYVSPSQRYSGEDVEILNKRKTVYEAAKAARPERWSRGRRLWARPTSVFLNPDKTSQEALAN